MVGPDAACFFSLTRGFSSARVEAPSNETKTDIQSAISPPVAAAGEEAGSEAQRGRTENARHLAQMAEGEARLGGEIDG